MTKLNKLSSVVWPVTAIPSMGNTDNSAEQDSIRKGPEHHALADRFARIMGGDLVTDVTTATISPEAVTVRDAEEDGAKVEWAPLDPRIAAYMRNTKG